MHTEERYGPILPASKLANIVESQDTIINVGMDVFGNVYKIVEIVDNDNDHFYAVLRRDEVVVLTTDRRIAGRVFIDFTGMTPN